MFPITNILNKVEILEQTYYKKIYFKITLFFIVIFSYSFLLSKITDASDWFIIENKIQNGMLNNMIHFSFTTFTTTGYGDIVPISRRSRILTHILMSLAFVIAIL